MSRPSDEIDEALEGPQNNPNHDTSPPQFLLAHIFMASDFLTQLTKKTDVSKLISKIERDKRNINTTLLQPIYTEYSENKALKINTFADGS
jgi:hypothetical protein